MLRNATALDRDEVARRLGWEVTLWGCYKFFPARPPDRERPPDAGWVTLPDGRQVRVVVRST